MAITGRKRGKVVIEGMTELQKKLDALPEAATAKLKQAILDGATNVAETAYVAAPVRTGRLRNSIDVVTDNNGLDALVVVRAPHAHLLEFGTIKMAAQPFLFPAYRLERPRLKRKIKAEVKRALRSVASR